MRRRARFQHEGTQGGDQVPALLSCRRVTRSFGALNAVNRLSLDVDAGIIFGIGGPNGAGKTTLFDLICGVTALTSGEIHFAGQQISGRRPFEICHAGIARTFQLNAAFETMTVRENVLVAAHHGHAPRQVPKLVFNQAERRHSLGVLETCGLADHADQPAARLPLLQQKLLMIAAALATGPKLLLLDEPVGGLIPREIDVIETLIRTLAKSHSLTVMLIEHVMRFLTGLSDEVMIMNQGELLYRGPPGGLADDAKVVEVYLGEGASGRLRAAPATPLHPGAEIDAAETADADEGADTELAGAARALLRQYRSGRVYPIDYLRLERALSDDAPTPRSGVLARLAGDVVAAERAGRDLKQPFESLARALDGREAGQKRRRARPAAPLSPEAARARAIEQAAARLLAIQDDSSEDAASALKAALALPADPAPSERRP